MLSSKVAFCFLMIPLQTVALLKSIVIGLPSQAIHSELRLICEYACHFKLFRCTLQIGCIGKKSDHTDEARDHSLKRRTLHIEHFLCKMPHGASLAHAQCHKKNMYYKRPQTAEGVCTVRSAPGLTEKGGHHLETEPDTSPGSMW